MRLFLIIKRRKEICECGNLKMNTVYSALNRLKKKNILVSNNGKILLNPKLFFFGDDLSRIKTFELKLKYEICLDC